MQWSPPASYVNAQQANIPPPEEFSCVVVHADTAYRTEIVVSKTTTGRKLKDMIRTSYLQHFPVHALNDDPSLPAIVSDKWLDLHVEIAGSPGGSRGLKCKLFDAWPLRAALLGLTDDTFYKDGVNIIYVIRAPSAPTLLFESLPQRLHQWPTLAPVIAKYIVDDGDTAMASLDGALQDSNLMMFVVWDATKKKDTNNDPRQRFLKEMLDILHFRKEKIQGMTLLEAVPRATR